MQDVIVLCLDVYLGFGVVFRRSRVAPTSEQLKRPLTHISFYRNMVEKLPNIDHNIRSYRGRRFLFLFFWECFRRVKLQPPREKNGTHIFGFDIKWPTSSDCLSLKFQGWPWPIQRAKGTLVVLGFAHAFGNRIVPQAARKHRAVLLTRKHL